VASPALRGELARVLAYPKLTAIFDDPAALGMKADQGLARSRCGCLRWLAARRARMSPGAVRRAGG
jgi:hypothetical protein